MEFFVIMNTLCSDEREGDLSETAPRLISLDPTTTTLEHDDVDVIFDDVSEEVAASNKREAPRSEKHRTVQKPRETAADLLLKLAEDVELFHTPDHEAFATVISGERKETLGIMSRTFKRWLRKRYYETYGGAPSSNALNEALGAIEAQAQFAGAAAPVLIRVARHEDTVYVDLAREDGAIVAVTANGWYVAKDVPVHFSRTPGMAPLPLPEHGGRIEALRPFVNVADDASFVLLVSWLVMALWPTGPFPVLAVSGEQGSAKSTISRICRALVDPSSADIRLTPSNARDLMIAAKSARVLAYDNLSGLPGWLSDALCTLATGSGFSTRKLTTDADEMLFHAARPIILNGIDQIATRADLADRAVLLNLPAIPDKMRRAEEDFWKAFASTQPRILGALLDGVSNVLGNIGNVRLAAMPRMADFAKIATAAAPAFGWTANTFMDAYEKNRTVTVSGVLNADLVAQAVIDFLEDIPNGVWEGNATTLLSLLAEKVPESARRTKGWPQAPHILSGRLNRAQSHLRTLGIVIADLPRRGRQGQRSLRLSRPQELRVQEKATPAATPPVGLHEERQHDGKRQHAEVYEGTGLPDESRSSDGADASDADIHEQQCEALAS